MPGGAAVAPQWRGEARTALPWIVAGVALYAVSLLITTGLSVPPDDRPASAGDPSKLRDPAAVRERFEAAWVRWNAARTLACTASLGCLAWAMRVAARA